MLKRKLENIDGRGYKAYKSIKGAHKIENFTLYIDHVQGDPYAAPSKMRIRLDNSAAGFPQETYSPEVRKTASRDYITRAFHKAVKKSSSGGRGSGKSGLIQIDAPGQEIIQRSSCILNEDFVEVRFTLGLPARGRRVLGYQAIKMLFDELPIIVKNSLYYSNINPAGMKKHIDTGEIQHLLRKKLSEKNLISFIADNSVLPRKSGISEKPLEKNAVPFNSPETLRTSIETEKYGEFTGMGIKKGITLIAGGGYHGKSTLLNGIAKGIYNHIPGDGRELLVTEESAVSIRSEDGRFVEKVNISPFINNLPHMADTTAFSSENASGSTSQAANIMEALEAGAGVLLVDEDTSATNFMIRDERMQELISKEKEPITPFIDKVKQMENELGISTVLVMGGSGDYFEVADTVIAMERYRSIDVTPEAKDIASRHETKRNPEGGSGFGKIIPRTPISGSIDPSRGKRSVKLKVRRESEISFGKYLIDLTKVNQLVSSSQLRAIANIIVYALKNNLFDESKTLKETLDIIQERIDNEGLDIIAPGIQGNFARPRVIETALALNRLRSLKVKQSPT